MSQSGDWVEMGTRLEDIPVSLELLEWTTGKKGISFHYPAVTLHAGHTFVLALAYHQDQQQEQLWLHNPEVPHAPVLLHTTRASILSPTLLSLPNNELWACWIEGPEYALWAARYDPEQQCLVRPMVLSETATRCMHLVCHRGADRLWLAWEAWAKDASCAIHARVYDGRSGWSSIRHLTPRSGRAYWPAIVEACEQVWLSWCTPNAAADGYDVYLGVYTSGQPHQEARVFQLNHQLPGNFHLYPHLQTNRQGEVWVAWTANTELEYYDLIRWPGNSDFAYIQDERSRRKRNIWWKYGNAIALRLTIDNGQLLRERPGASDDWGRVPEAGHCHYPALLLQNQGLPSLLARRLTPHYLFETFRTTCNQGTWGAPQSLNPPLLQIGRNSPLAFAWDPGSALVTAAQQAVSVVEGERYIGSRPSTESAILLLKWQEVAAGSEEEKLVALPPVPDCSWEQASSPLTPRTPRTLPDGRRVFFGNIHVHSDLSGCRRDTQQTVDFNYRWARDLMQQDFHALTDHAEHMVPYDWKWTQAMHAFFQFPGYFVSLLAYEWTMNDFADHAHSGHCNVLLRQPMPRALGCDDELTSTLPRLWSQLEVEQAMTIPHHTASFPFLRDFSMHDPRFERLIEVHQDRRGNYEYPGCPGEYGTVVLFQAREHNIPGGYVVDALEKGLHLGLCAGGDHMGISMSGVYAQSLESEAIFDALYHRQCYGVTGAKIMLEFSARTEEWASHPIRTEALPQQWGARRVTFRVRATGTAPIQQVDLISGGEVVQTARTGISGPEAHVAFDTISAGLRPFYYARVIQLDGQMAWSSPIWTDKT